MPIIGHLITMPHAHTEAPCKACLLTAARGGAKVASYPFVVETPVPYVLRDEHLALSDGPTCPVTRPLPSVDKSRGPSAFDLYYDGLCREAFLGAYPAPGVFEARQDFDRNNL